VMQDNHRATLGLDFLAVPLVFVFAWVYAAFGAIAAATLWVPILGLRQVQRTNLELEQTNEELLELMVKSIEARDPYTSGHSRRVQQFSTIIARAIGLPDREVQEIGRAALLHDVGKIYEKYAGVLSKQDKLTPEEWAIIQEHPADGANLVATMTRLRDLVPAVRHHHENWDGTGYPDRIAGEAIPIGARILSVVDCFDALTSDRPYRRRMSNADAIAILRERRGTMYDPLVVDVFAANYKRIMPGEEAVAHPATKAVGGAREADPPPPQESQEADAASGADTDAFNEVLTISSLARAVSGNASLSDVGAL